MEMPNWPVRAPLPCTQADVETRLSPWDRTSGECCYWPEPGPQRPGAGMGPGPRPLELMSRSYAPMPAYSQVHPWVSADWGEFGGTTFGAITGSHGGSIPAGAGMPVCRQLHPAGSFQAGMREYECGRGVCLSGRKDGIVNFRLCKTGILETEIAGGYTQAQSSQSICGRAEKWILSGPCQKMKKELRQGYLPPCLLQFNTEKKAGVLAGDWHGQKGLCLEMTRGRCWAWRRQGRDRCSACLGDGLKGGRGCGLLSFSNPLWFLRPGWPG